MAASRRMDDDELRAATKVQTRLHPPAARGARVVCTNVAPSEKQRAQGMPGARCARSRVWCVESTRVSHHGHTGNTRHSPRNGFTAYIALSPVTGLSCHRHPRKLPSANLTPASGRQDHTTSPSASGALRRCAPSASTASRLTSVTIAKRPFVGTGRGELVEMICPTAKAEYFFDQDWTDKIRLISFRKFRFTRK